MGTRARGRVDETTTLQFQFLKAGVPFDAFNVRQVTIHPTHADAVANTNIIETIPAVGITRVGVGLYQYTAAIIPAAGPYFDKIFLTPEFGDPETSFINSFTLYDFIGVVPDKVGYSFNNYVVPTGEWGKVLTPDDMRYSYLWGTDCVGSDSGKTPWTDEQFDWLVDNAVAEFERYLGISIRKRIYKTNPNPALVRAKKWVAGVDYTDEEMDYDFREEMWKQYGIIQLRHMPVLSIERAIMKDPLGNTIMDLLASGIVKLSKETGQVHIFPQGSRLIGYQTPMLSMFRGSYPNCFEFDYTVGYPNSDFVPGDLRDVVGKWAGIDALDTIGDGLLAGFSSMSVSLDGLSESFSSTQSATSGYFGPRQISYGKAIVAWLEKNRYKYGGSPVEFIGV